MIDRGRLGVKRKKGVCAKEYRTESRDNLIIS